MSNKNFDVYFDCGASKLRTIALNKENSKNYFYEESNFFFNHENIEIEIQKMVSSIENNTKEYQDVFKRKELKKKDYHKMERLLSIMEKLNLIFVYHFCRCKALLKEW